MENRKNLVFIYSIPRPSAVKLDEFTSDSSGVKLKKNKNGDTRDIISALYNPRTGRLATGLDKPWLENGEQKTENGIGLTLQDKYERKYNRPKGYYTSTANLSMESFYKDSRELTYFESKSWPLQDGCTVIDLDVEDDVMFYHVCLESKFVANSEKEWKEHKWPKATHYIAIENEQEEIKYKKNQSKLEAFSALNNKDILPTVKRKIAIILELANSKSNASEEQITNLLYQYIDNGDNNANIGKFLSLVRLLNTADGKVEFEARYTLKQAVDLRIITINKGTYTWIRPKGSIELGNKPESAIEFLTDTKKADLISELQNEIKVRS